MLGDFAVYRGAREIDHASWGRPLVARLVRFLLVHRASAVAEDVLFDAFWPDMTAQAARRNLSVTLSLARKALDVPGAAASVVATENRRHRLQLRMGDHVDAEEFEAAAAAALAEAGPGRLALLERAAALWTGTPLPEERYADWSVAWRARLIARYSHVLRSLNDHYAAEGRSDDAVRVACERVQLDPLDEGAQRELITSYARAGSRSHALQQFADCRCALADELGIEPSPATVDLHERVRAGVL